VLEQWHGQSRHAWFARRLPPHCLFSWSMRTPVFQRLISRAGETEKQSGKLEFEPPRPPSSAALARKQWGGADWLDGRDGLLPGGDVLRLSRKRNFARGRAAEHPQATRPACMCMPVPGRWLSHPSGFPRGWFGSVQLSKQPQRGRIGLIRGQCRPQAPKQSGHCGRNT
jgi:hypothetical protein